MKETSALPVPGALGHYLPLNAIERLGDGILFDRPIFSSLETFLAGHPKPMDRAVRSSPHNCDIDLTYNFGILTLPPVLGLIAYALRPARMRRRDI